MENRYKIGDFARMLGVCVGTLQRWDRTGELPAYRTTTNRRYYTDEHLKKLKEMEKKNG